MRCSWETWCSSFTLTWYASSIFLLSEFISGRVHNFESDHIYQLFYGRKSPVKIEKIFEDWVVFITSLEVSDLEANFVTFFFVLYLLIKLIYRKKSWIRLFNIGQKILKNVSKHHLSVSSFWFDHRC